MHKKDLMGNWLHKSFLFTGAMKKLSGEVEGYSALQTFLPGSRAMPVEHKGEKGDLTAEGCKWLTYLPMDEHWALMAFYDPQGKIICWYFDISRRNYIDENGMPCRDDLYLDLSIMPDGETITVDADELQEALDKGDITAEDYDFAYRVHDQLMNSDWIDVKQLTALCDRLLEDYL